MTRLRNRIVWRTVFSAFLAFALIASCLPCLTAQTQSAHQCCPNHEKSKQPDSRSSSSQGDCALGSVDTLSLRPHAGPILALVAAEFVVLKDMSELSFVPVLTPLGASPGNPVIPLILRV
jgi:hypothetical protein